MPSDPLPAVLAAIGALLIGLGIISVERDVSEARHLFAAGAICVAIGAGLLAFS